MLVDELSTILDRSVLIEDLELRPVAYSACTGREDEARVRAILERRAPREVRAIHRGLHLETAHGATRITIPAELNMGSRVEAPLRAAGHLVGYLSVLDPDKALGPTDFELIDRVAADAAEVLHAETSRRDRDAAEIQALLHRLLIDPDEASNALSELTTRGVDLASSMVTSCVISSEADGKLSRSVSRLVDELRIAARVPRAAVHTVDLGPTGLAAVCVDESWRHVVEPLAMRGSLWIGVGNTVAAPSAAETHRQALFAAQVVRVLEDGRTLARFEDLGAYRSLFGLDIDALGPEHVPPRLWALASDPKRRELVLTLEAYLDAAGDARKSAERLSLHRTSLYSRLERIEGLLGLSLRDGDARLALHMGLRVLRLSGALRGHHPTDARLSA